MAQAEQYIFTDPMKAISYANNAIVKAERNNDSLQIVGAYISLGRAYINLGAFDQAFEAFYNAYDRCKKEDLRAIASVNVNLATLYRIFSDHNRSFEYTDKAMDTYKRLGDSVGMALCYNTGGLVFVNMGRNDSAEVSFKQALSINRRLGFPKEISKNLNNLCLYEGDTEEKIGMLNEAIRINESLGATWSIGENYNNLGNQYFYAKDYGKALVCLKKAMEYANMLQAKELICDNYKYQSLVYTGLGDYKKAYENLMNLYETEKELLSDNNIRQIEHEVSDRRFYEQQRKLSSNQKEIQIKNLKYRIIFVLGGFSIIMLAAAFVLMRSRHRKKIQLIETGKKLEASESERMKLQLARTESERDDVKTELNHSKRELTNLACHIRSRNELLDKLKLMLQECYKDAPENFKAQLKGITAFITQYQDQEDELNILTRDIDRINGEFIARLTTLHPDLSPKEKQLASFLRIDLSTKEIALLTGAVPKSVNMARYRLRKHFDLDSDDSLNEYIKGI